MTTAYETEYFTNDLGELIDLLLNTSEVRKAFMTRGSKVWVDKVSDDFLRAGLKELTARQIFIIENLLLRDKSIIDVCFGLGISYETFQKELQDMRKTLGRLL